VTVTVWFAITTGALRVAPPFASTVSFTAPLPEPAGASRWIQPASVVAFHEHDPDDASIDAVAAPPPAPIATLVGETLKRHGAPSCTMSTFVVLTSTVARRGDESVFAATR
jgi:hypothetical protein